MVKLFNNPYAATEFKPEYATLRDAANTDIASVGKAYRAAAKESPAVKTALSELHGAAKAAEKALAAKPEDAELKKVATEATEKLDKFLRGDVAHKVGETEVKLSDTLGKGLKDSYGKAQDSVKKITEPASSWIGKVKTQGFGAAAKDNIVRGMNPFHAANEGFKGKGLAFAKAGVAAASVYGLGDSILRSKDAEGNDRSFGSRFVEGGSSLLALSAMVLAGGVGKMGNVSTAVAR